MYPNELDATKRRGKKLGGFRAGAKLTHEARRAGNAARTAIAPAKTADLAPIIAELRSIGATSLRALAAGLNERGIPTASGNSAMQVARSWHGEIKVATK